jgi:hypothetical protein
MDTAESMTNENDRAQKLTVMRQLIIYRELTKQISRSANGTLFWALMMGLLWYFAYVGQGMPRWEKIPLYGYIHLTIVILDLVTGLWKKIAPSPITMLIDAVLLLGFAGLFFYNAYRRQGGIGVGIAFGIYMLIHAYQQFNAWRSLNQLLIVKPTRAQLRWFDDLIREIKKSNPTLDETAMTLDSSPPWKAKLLGDIAFFVSSTGAVEVASQNEIELMATRPDEDEVDAHPSERPYRRNAMMSVNDVTIGPFMIDEFSLRNYDRWSKS